MKDKMTGRIVLATSLWGGTTMFGIYLAARAVLDDTDLDHPLAVVVFVQAGLAVWGIVESSRAANAANTDAEVDG